MTYIGINPRINIDPFVSVKLPESYSKEVLNEIKFITFDNKHPAVPFGSYIYRIQKYPGDIDLVEQITGDNKEDVINQFEQSLKKIVKKILKKRTHYYSEVKAGIDKRYDIDLGNIKNGTWIPSSNLLLYSLELYNNKLLDQIEYNAIEEILTQNNIPNGDDYDVINYIFRERMILRWNPQEILSGKKKLPGNKIITLNEALHSKSHVKIDEIALVDSKFVEITNFIALGYYKNGMLIPINVNLEEQHDKLIQLPPEIEKLYFSNMYYSPFKMIKRMYSLARSSKNNTLLLKIIPFVSSNISLLYQIKSEIDTIILLLEKLKSIPEKSIFKQLDGMKNRLSNVLELTDNELEFYYIYIDMVNSTKSKEEKIRLLEELNKEIKRIINSETIKYLIIKDLNPPPKEYLPSQLKYQYLPRNINSNPKNPKTYFDL